MKKKIPPHHRCWFLLPLLSLENVVYRELCFRVERILHLCSADACMRHKRNTPDDRLYHAHDAPSLLRQCCDNTWHIWRRNFWNKLLQVKRQSITDLCGSSYGQMRSNISSYSTKLGEQKPTVYMHMQCISLCLDTPLDVVLVLDYAIYSKYVDLIYFTLESLFEPLYYNL